MKSAFEIAIHSVFGQKLIDDPILFDPSKKLTKRQLQMFDINSLASPSLGALSTVIFKNVLGGTVHHIEHK